MTLYTTLTTRTGNVSITGTVPLFLPSGCTKMVKKEGKWISFYDNGHIQYTGIYLEGKKDREWRGWHYDDRLRSVERYSDGRLHGEC